LALKYRSYAVYVLSYNYDRNTPAFVVLRVRISHIEIETIEVSV